MEAIPEFVWRMYTKSTISYNAVLLNTPDLGNTRPELLTFGKELDWLRAAFS